MFISVRRVCNQDWPELRSIFLESRRCTFYWLETQRLQLAELDEQTQGELILVAQNSSQEVIGFISVWENDNFIHHLYVKPSFEGKGVGRTLINALPDWGRKSYSLKCTKLNHNAIGFYQSCGFKVFSEGNDIDGEYVYFRYEGSST